MTRKGVTYPCICLDMTFLYLAKDKRRRKETQPEQKKEKIERLSDTPNWRNRQQKKPPITKSISITLTAKETGINEEKRPIQMNKNQKSTIQDEEDEEEWKTQTLNPLADDETSLLMAFINEGGEEIWI